MVTLYELMILMMYDCEHSIIISTASGDGLLTIPIISAVSYLQEHDVLLVRSDIQHLTQQVVYHYPTHID